ncbi:MAG: acetyl-CoA carboxylase biotin carboxyl carrier protein subunit, partial [Caldilinea sp.]
NGQVFAVWPEEVEGVAAATPTASAAPKRAPATPSVSAAALSGQTNVVTAPLPGDVVVVAVKPGDVVEVGQLLCTVESMKMNNPIRSIQAGVVEQVLIAVGDHVNHGQPLLTLRQTNH